jgi:hypothetical protein
MNNGWLAGYPSASKIAATFPLLNTDTEDVSIYQSYHYSFFLPSSLSLSEIMTTIVV